MTVKSSSITVRSFDPTLNHNRTGVYVNKFELVEKVATETNETKTAVEDILDAAIRTIQSAIAEGLDVKIVGFGTFTTIERKARKGRNPQTGAPVNIPAARVPKFRPGKEFRELFK